MGKNKGKGKEKSKAKQNSALEKLDKGITLYNKHPLFRRIYTFLRMRNKEQLGKETTAIVTRDGDVYVNEDYHLEPEQWAYAIAHCQLHLCFGHFDAEKMPEKHFDKRLWNMACDIYVSKFLKDIKFGKSLTATELDTLGCTFTDEVKIYQYLKEHGVTGLRQEFGTASIGAMDMHGLEKPIVYDQYSHNDFAEEFAEALAHSAAEAISVSGGHGTLDDKIESEAEEARNWFVNHYPLLGNLASIFKIVEDSKICTTEEIGIAAIDVEAREIFVNPGASLSSEEMKFVMAHELLHAGLGHQERCQGREPYLWNVACDFVINGWLQELGIGKMPSEGLLYDPIYKDWSAEGIYDELVKEIKKNRKLETFRKYQKGDILDRHSGKSMDISGGMTLDEFCESALAQGLEYHTSHGRGLVPAGMVEEIRVLTMPPVPWDVELARWFDCNFPPIEKRYTYARPSRRQGATPDIPRPSYAGMTVDEMSRTFGVIIDTSGSMSAKMIGQALGSIASYATAKEVPFARVIFCDAAACDAGYLSPEDIAGRVEVKGRGGTRMQPAVDLLEGASDFPKRGPILIITDGELEENLKVRHEHAYLIPKGRRLPFKAKGEVFYFEKICRVTESVIGESYNKAINSFCSSIL